MAHMSVVFLGTSSGGGPSESRNCSSLVCDMLGDYSLWMVDCAEGTTRQFALQPAYLNPSLRIQNVTKIFITHMHVDHIMGIVPFLRSVLFPPPIGDSSSTFQQRTIELYGPAGLRTFVRQIMKMTLTRTSDTYIVHELLRPEDPVTPCDDAPKDSPARMDPALPNVMHYSELRGTDFMATADGFWKGITQGKGTYHGVDVNVDAGPILHRDPCIGYVFTENQHPSRKLVILGDTYDPSAIAPLCHGASLLVHEATDSHISWKADPSGKWSKRTPNVVQEKALSRGHSIPEMAGAFAQKIGAKALVLNHIGSRFPAPRNPRDFTRLNIMNDIERHANDAWKSGKRCIAAYDFLRVNVPIELSSGPPSKLNNPEPQEQEQQMVEPVNESNPERGEGRKRRRSVGSVDTPVAEGLETRNLDNARGGGRGRSRFRSGNPNTRGRGFYRNAGHSWGDGTGNMRRPF